MNGKVLWDRLRVPRGSADYYATLLALLFDQQLTRRAFLGVLTRVLQHFDVSLSRDAMKSSDELPATCLETEGRISAAVTVDRDELLRSMPTSVQGDVDTILRMLPQQHKAPWLFLATGRVVGELTATSPTSFLPLIHEFGRSDHSSYQQTAAEACETASMARHAQSDVEVVLETLRHLQGNSRSENVRKRARRALRKWGSRYPIQTNAALKTWCADENSHIRRSVAEILSEEWVDELTFEYARKALRSDSDTRVHEKLAESSKKRFRDKHSDVAERIRRVWQITDEEVFKSEMKQLRNDVPSEEFWKAIRREVMTPLLATGEWSPFDDAVRRLRSFYPQYPNIVRAVAPTVLDEWKSDPKRVQRMLGEWIREGKGRTFFTQAFRTHGGEYAELFVAILLDLSVQNRIPESPYQTNLGDVESEPHDLGDLLNLLDDLVRGKVKTDSRYKRRIGNNIVIALSKVFSSERKVLERLLSTWLRAEDDFAVETAVAAIVRCASEGDRRAIQLLWDALTERSTMRRIFFVMSQIALRGNRYLAIVLEFAYQALKSPDLRLRRGAVNLIDRVEAVLGYQNRSSLPMLEDLYRAEFGDIPRIMYHIWNRSELVRLIGMRCSELWDVAPIFDVCQKAERHPVGEDPESSLRHMLRGYVAALQDRKHELKYLYDVLDTAMATFGGRKKAAIELGLPERDLRALSNITNGPYIGSRHVGQHSAKDLVSVPDAEREKAFDIAKAIFLNYVKYLAPPPT